MASRVSLAVPGISSSLSAPLFAGVPLTDKTLSRHFAVTSCHEPDAMDWAAFRGIDTLVLLMAGAKLPMVVDRLQHHTQRAQSTPVLVVRSAGTPEETVWDATLGSVLQVTAGEKLSPCVVVVGAVADRSLWLSSLQASDAPTFGV
jgi:siroheme synthase